MANRGISTVQSFNKGKYAQSVFKGINTALGVHGLKKAFGSAMATFKDSSNSSSPTNTISNSVANNGSTPKNAKLSFDEALKNWSVQG
ncbi:hypothetical protein ACTQ3M_04690 [Oscillospiraceae bacterium LCP25S3_E10]|nr:hypothetical protein [Ruminococcus sp.]MDD6447488.1 hypothetical protein [Ruminococcus sp.]